MLGKIKKVKNQKFKKGYAMKAIGSNLTPILSIAGSDCSGGAGIQADLKTFSAHKLFGMSVIVSVVAENTARVISCFDISKWKT